MKELGHPGNELVQKAHVEHPYGYWGYVASKVNQWLFEVSTAVPWEKAPSVDHLLWLDMGEFFLNVKLSVAKSTLTMEHGLAVQAVFVMLGGKEETQDVRRVDAIIQEAAGLFDSLKPRSKYTSEEMVEYQLLVSFLGSLYRIDEYQSEFAEAIWPAYPLPEEHYFVEH